MFAHVYIFIIVIFDINFHHIKIHYIYTTTP